MNIRLLSVIVLSVVFFAAVFPASFYRDLWEPDEPRFAQVAREMVASGDYVMPHRNERPYPDKPPLYFWTIALVSGITGGVNAPAALLPVALAGSLTILLTFLLARKLTGNEWTAFWAALILASTVKIYWQASHAQIDMVLTFLTSGAFYFMVLHLSRSTGSRWEIILAWLFMGLGVLTKGPVAVIVPVGSMVTYLIWKRLPIRTLFPPAAILTFCVVVFSWAGLLLVQGLMMGEGGYLQNIFFKQTVVRFARSWHHHQPVYYFLKVILHDFFPWSPFLVLLFWQYIRKKRTPDDTEKLLLAAVLFIMFFFSLPMGKRGLYILPLYPMASILVAILLSDQSDTKAVRMCGWISGGLLATVGAALLVLGKLHVPGGDVAHIRIPGLLLILTSSLVLAKGKWPRTGLAAAMFVVILIIGYRVNPAMDERNSARTFVQENAKIMGSEGVLALAQYRSAHVYYGDRWVREFDGIDEEDNLAEFVRFLMDGPDRYGILSKEWTDALSQMNLPVEILNEAVVGHKELCLIQVGQQPTVHTGVVENNTEF